MPASALDDGPAPRAALLPVADAAALTAAYRAYRGPLVRYACRITGDLAAAHDVVQDVFVKVWEAREALIVRSSFSALLYTMTRNRALNDHRRHARIAAGVDVEDADGEAAFLSGAPDTPETALEADELGRHLRRGIDALPPRRAEAFTLSRFHALSHAEIAGVMGLSVRTVDTHVVHALRDLRAHLDALYRGPAGPPHAP